MINKKVGKWGILGMIGNGVFFRWLIHTYIYISYHIISYHILMSKNWNSTGDDISSFFQDDFWFGPNFSPVFFSFMSPLLAASFVKNLCWASKTHHFWASTRSPWMFRLAKLRWSFSKKAWCCEKTKRACEAQLKEGGWGVFPCGCWVEVRRFLCFYSWWMQICWRNKSICLCYHGVGVGNIFQGMC